MHPPNVRRAALELIAAGHNDCEVSRRLGIPRRTIADWRRPTYVSRRGFATDTCPRCWQPMKPIRAAADDYAEFLAMYLGDGCISELERTQRLRITLDLRHPNVIERAHELTTRVFPHNRVTAFERAACRCVDLSVYSSHLSCLLPQHGPGKKHDRRIALEPWQVRAVERNPWSFLRGAIATDGCVFINRTGPYEYLGYHFCNRSRDIACLVVAVMEQMGVQPRLTHDRRRDVWTVRVNRRASVALMVSNVGVKG
jgi:hypothetical protein